MIIKRSETNEREFIKKNRDRGPISKLRTSFNETESRLSCLLTPYYFLQSLNIHNLYHKQN